VLHDFFRGFCMNFFFFFACVLQFWKMCLAEIWCGSCTPTVKEREGEGLISFVLSGGFLTILLL
jgi:hypothetical protein